MEKPKDRATTSEMQGQLPGGVLEELAREGVRQLLAQALEAEVAEFLEKHQDNIDEEGRRRAVRNGYHVAQDRMKGKQDMTCQDWFFCTRKLDRNTVLGRVLKK
jgi:hypothetical protein